MKHRGQLFRSHAVAEGEADFHHQFGALVREGAGAKDAVGSAVTD